MVRKSYQISYLAHPSAWAQTAPVQGSATDSTVFQQELELLRPRSLLFSESRPDYRKTSVGHTHSGRQTPARFLSWPCAGRELRMAHCG